VILLDTHAWVWLASAPSNLSAAAASAIARADVVGVSPISAWEIAMLAAKGKIHLSLDASTWVAAGLALDRVRLVPLTAEAAVLAVSLRRDLNRDPADCLIVATAITQRIPLVSKDRRVRAFAGVDATW